MNKPAVLFCLCLLSALSVGSLASYAANAPYAGTMNSTDVDTLRTKAQAGDAAAQYELGRIYERGHGVRQDYAQAKRWLGKAAAQGNVEAELRLGILYDLGEGVVPNSAEAVKWYKLAAAQNNVTAELRLGDLYANQFRASTFAANDRTTPLNHPEPVADYREEALKWYRRAANTGNPEAQASLGNLYAGDLGYREEAYFWFSLAAMTDPTYKPLRDKAASRLAPEKIAAVQKNLQNWKPVDPALVSAPLPPAQATPPASVPMSSLPSQPDLRPSEQTATPAQPLTTLSPQVFAASPPPSSPVISSLPVGHDGTPDWRSAPTQPLSSAAPIVSLPPPQH